MKIYNCYFDGCCEPMNPNGTMGFGVYILNEDNQFRKSDFIPAEIGNTNNIAEYLALTMLLNTLNKKEDCIINIYGDSMLVINQMSGDWKIKNGAYVPYATHTLKLLNELRKRNTIKLQWIPREKNIIADELSKSHLKK